MKTCIDEDVKKNKYITYEQLYEIQTQLLNYTDSAILECLWNGISGKELHDLTHLEREQVSASKMEITFEDGKVIKIYPGLCELLDKAFNNVSDVNNLDNYVSKINTCNNDIHINKDTKTIMLNYASIVKNIITHCTVLNAYISKIEPKIDTIYDLDLKQIDLRNTVSSTKKNIKIIQENISKTKKERNQFILDKGYCPCCGQHIYEAVHSNAIANFFTEA